MDITPPPKALASPAMGLSSAKPVKSLPREYMDPEADTITGRPENSPRLQSPPLTEKVKWAPTPARPARSASPTKERPSTKVSLTGDVTNDAGNRPRKGGFNLEAWFQGTSAPVTLGLSSRQDAAAYEPDPAVIELNRLPERRSSTEAGFALPAPIKRLSFFSPRVSREEPTSSSQATDDDEFDNVVNSSSTLFTPYLNGTTDATSIGDLKASIDKMLARLQRIHHAQKAALQRHVTDCEVLQDERDEAESRADLIKTQFETLAARLTEQERANQDLARELALERQRRVTEDEARKRSILLVRKARLGSGKDDDNDQEGSMIPGEPDPGYYSEAESSTTDATLFERQSAQSSISGVGSESLDSPPSSPDHSSSSSSGASRSSVASRPRLIPRLSTFQKVLKDISGASDSSINATNTTTSISSSHEIPPQQVVSGGGAIMEENRLLKERIAELEQTVENCLSLIGS